MIARLLPLLLLLVVLSPAPGSASVTTFQTAGSSAETVQSRESVVRIDTIHVGDSIVRVDSIVFHNPLGDRPMSSLRRSLPRVAAADTLDAIAVQGLTVEILRSPMDLDAVPFAVSVLDDELWTTGRSNGSIEEALQGLPGVQIHNRFNDAVGERVSIRGHGARSEFGVRGVKILVDGIPATLPDGQSTLDHLDLGSLGRVEALRGPGSALYGNAAGGVLHFETRAPANAPLREEVRVVEGEYGYRRRQSTTSGRAGDTGYLVNVARYEFGGYRTNPFGAAAPGPLGTAMYGSALRDHLNARVATPLLGGEVTLTANAVRLDAEDAGALSREQLEPGDRRAFPLNVQQRAGKDAVQTQGGIRWNGGVAGRDVELMVYGVGRGEDRTDATTRTDLDRTVGGFRATMRSEYAGDEGRLWWTLGVDSDLQNDDRVSWLHAEGDRLERTLDQEERVWGGAVFLQAMLPINRMLDVLTGLRYDRIRFSARDRMPGGDAGPDASGARTLDSASPSFGFHAGFHPAFALYLNLSTAFETPTTTELARRADGGRGFDPDLEPQVGITTEIGGRGVLAPVLAWEAVFFHTTLHNELIPFELESEPGKRYFRNSARSTRQGWEVALQMSPDPNISGRLVFSTNDARFRSFSVGDREFDGNRVPGLAPRKIEGILRVGPGRWFAEVRGEGTGAIEGNDANLPEARSPAYRLVDLRAGANDIEVMGLSFSPFAGVTNVFDEVYNTSVVVNAHGGRHFEPGPGRAMYLGGSVAFELR